MENKFLGSTGLAKFLERLYDTFSKVGHTHDKSQIIDFPTVPTNTSQLTNDSGFVTADELDETIIVDAELSESSENPVQNKVIKTEFDLVHDLIGDDSVEAQIAKAIDRLGCGDNNPIFVQPEEPEDAIEGTIWIDTDENISENVVDPDGNINATTLNGKTESELSVAKSADSDKLGGKTPDYYASAEQVKKAAPRNLLINSDFTDPVNQKGVTKVDEKYAYFIDLWARTLTTGTVKLIDEGIEIINTGTDNGGIRQSISINNGVYTLACVVNNEPYCRCITITDGVLSYGTKTNRDDFQIYPNISNGMLNFTMQAFNGKTVIIKNAAIYEGEYTINNLPNYHPNGYENELLVCRQYDPNTGAYIGLRKFGQPRNLLDNSDFRNPVNQRGIVSGTKHNTWTYTLDRWTTGGNTPTITFDRSGLSTDANISQYIEGLHVYFGKKMTLACKMANGSIGILNFTMADASAWTSFGVVNFEADGRLQVTSSSSGKIAVVMKGTNILWVALYEGEYTLDTLPEYQPKGYGAELAECRRYFYKIRAYWKYLASGICASTTEAHITIRLPENMRCVPSVTIKNPSMVRIKCGNMVSQVPSAVNWNSANDFDHMQMSCTVSGATAGAVAMLYFDDNGIIEFSADL